MAGGTGEALRESGGADERRAGPRSPVPPPVDGVPARPGTAGPPPHPIGRTAPPLDPPPRPRIAEEPAILGLSRISRSRIGSRLFTWFFVLVYAVIFVQMVVAILNPG